MIPRIESYRSVVGDFVDELKSASEPLQDKHVAHINATSSGGGVAEILNTLVFLMNDLGIKTGWRVMVGSQSFFSITKEIHNSLQGKKWEFEGDLYLEYCRRNAILNHIENHDVVVIHDPQPLAMIDQYKKRNKWIWRCHIDVSHPYRPTLNALIPYIKQYDDMIVSNKNFKINLDIPQRIIYPSIDPLSDKNRKLSKKETKELLEKYDISTDVPILTQVSRFDPWKGYPGVVDMYKKIKGKRDCQLVLIGSMAADDPEGPSILRKIEKETGSDVKIITEKNDLLVNALQRESAVVFQNSSREGFALTVSEALWKNTPVVGRAVGGIPLQIINGETGFLIDSTDQGAARVIELLDNNNLRKRMGQAGHEHVKENFLITRHLMDYLRICI